MIDPEQLRVDIVRPTLHAIELHSYDAENLILGTIAQESAGGRYLRQLDGGPALGVCQMEPATFGDIWENYLAYRTRLATRLGQFIEGNHKASHMVGNLPYAVAMCRVHYLRVPAAMPTDVEGYARYWKRYYNTPLGKGTEAEFVHNYARFVE